MISNSHPISAVSLTLEMFNEILSDPELNSFDVQFLSPLGNLFVIGEIDDIEEIVAVEKSEDNSLEIREFTIIDAGETRRIVRFYNGMSTYAVLVSSHGLLRSTTGIPAPENEDKAEWEAMYLKEIGEDASEPSSGSIH